MNVPAPNNVIALSDPLWRRRELLVTAGNPRPQADYVVRLQHSFRYMQLCPEALSLDARFVPDKCILQASALAAYADGLTAQEWRSPEAVAATIFDDFNNQLVPRWLNLRLNLPGNHSVMLEESQPGWANGELLNRLESWS